MYGAIIGDMAGSAYEFWPTKDKDFYWFPRETRFTDDTVMTVAVAESLLELNAESQSRAEATDAADCGDAQQTANRGFGDLTDDEIRAAFVRNMKKWGRRYADAGYGGRFIDWLLLPETEPYGSYGNGSGMRVSPVGWMFDDMETTRRIARLSADVTHDHPEGIKGAEAVASAIFLARTGSSKAEIKAYIESEFDYDLGRTCAEIRPRYRFEVSCQKSVPEAIIAFLDGRDYESVIREAVSLGGDADTQGAMAGSIAEAFYGGVPERFREQADNLLPDDIREVAATFNEQIVLPRLEEADGYSQAKKVDAETASMRFGGFAKD